MKKTALILLVLVMVVPAWGQSLQSPNQTMVKNAVGQSVVVVCSGYKLQDSTGQRFGRSNRAEFSQGYTLGVMTDEGLLLAPSTTQPWAADGDYTRYRSTHTPVLSSIACRPVDDSLYKTLPLTVDSTHLPFLMRLDAETGVPALAAIGSRDGTPKGGWLLWVSASDTLGLVGSTSVTAILASPTVNDTALPQVNPPVPSILERDSVASRKTLGAIWVVPSYPQPGTIQFKVAGMAVRDAGAWRLVPLRATALHRGAAGDVLTPSPDNPSNKNDKKNKKIK